MDEEANVQRGILAEFKRLAKEEPNVRIQLQPPRKRVSDCTDEELAGAAAHYAENLIRQIKYLDRE